MLRKKVTFVLGAGASAEVRMPVGADLKRQVAAKFDFQFEPFQPGPTRGDRVLFDALTRLSPDYPKNVDEINEHLNVGQHIRTSVMQAPSIDEFIDNQRENPRIATCGKLGILRCILEAEQKSHLYFDDSKRENLFDLKEVDDKWYSHLFKIIIEGADFDTVVDRMKQINIVSFNYDRCLHHYLFNSLKNYFRRSDERVAEAISGLRIIFPYGTVAKLPWQSRDEPVKFGGPISGTRLFDLVENIKTFTEQIED